MAGELHEVTCPTLEKIPCFWPALGPGVQRDKRAGPGHGRPAKERAGVAQDRPHLSAAVSFWLEQHNPGRLGMAARKKRLIAPHADRVHTHRIQSGSGNPLPTSLYGDGQRSKMVDFTGQRSVFFQ